MALDDDYLRYPHRQAGMDHSLYPTSNLFERPKIAWPGGKKVALWITVALEFFPLTPNDGPVRAPGAMVTPFPDYRTFTTKDYGNRVGIYRIMRVLEAAGFKATAFMNSALARRYPALLGDVQGAGWEIAAHGVDMNHVHHGALPKEEERAQINACLDEFAAHNVQPKGWLSPARSESHQTSQLLAEAGVEWFGDWGNDDMPYAFSSGVTAMPFTDELEDRKCLVTLGQREEVWEEQVLDAYDWLSVEAADHGGRILHIALTPYVIGQPFRIQSLRNVLGHLGEKSDIWCASGTEICEAWCAGST